VLNLQWCLVKSKRGIVDNIDKVYNSHINTDASMKHIILERWNKINDNDLEIFPIAVNFIRYYYFNINRDIKTKNEE
jgi:hypothetical protein